MAYRNIPVPKEEHLIGVDALLVNHQGLKMKMVTLGSFSSPVLAETAPHLCARPEENAGMQIELLTGMCALALICNHQHLQGATEVCVLAPGIIILSRTLIQYAWTLDTSHTVWELIMMFVLKK